MSLNGGKPYAERDNGDCQKIALRCEHSGGKGQNL
ncbi:MAG: hypothetical protein H6Q07_1167, partial [Acidobacteria bacterium]|nr:hypothetical protein [Acidobacteriota bacterium]